MERAGISFDQHSVGAEHALNFSNTIRQSALHDVSLLNSQYSNYNDPWAGFSLVFQGALGGAGSIALGEILRAKHLTFTPDFLFNGGLGFALGRMMLGTFYDPAKVGGLWVIAAAIAWLFEGKVFLDALRYAPWLVPTNMFGFLTGLGLGFFARPK